MKISFDSPKFEPKKEGDIQRKKLQKPIKINLVLQVILICAAIDIPIWAYFHFVKGVGFWEGLEQIRKNVQSEKVEKIRKETNIKLYYQSEKNVIPSTKKEERHYHEIIIPLIQKEVNYDQKNIAPKRIVQRKAVVYSWIDEKGNKALSNVGFPKDGNYTNPKIEYQD